MFSTYVIVVVYVLCANNCLHTILNKDWLIVKKEWSDSFMNKWEVRIGFGLPPVLTSLACAVPPLFLEMYNNGRIHCMTIPYPATCINHDDIECTRGGALVLQTIGFAYALICNLVIILFMGLLVYEIYSQERRRDRYSAATHEVQRTYTRKAAWQGIRYTGAFTLAYVWMYIFMVSFHTILIFICNAAAC